MRAAAGAERLPVVELGHPSRADQAVPAHRDRLGLRGRGPRGRAVSGRGGRAGAAAAGGQTAMIRINLAPERGRRRKVGFKGIKLGLPAFNLGMLFGVVYLALVLGIGMYWWFLISTKASLTEKIDNANRELTALKAQIGQESKVRDLALELRKRVDAIEASTQAH